MTLNSLMGRMERKFYKWMHLYVSVSMTKAGFHIPFFYNAVDVENHKNGEYLVRLLL